MSNSPKFELRPFNVSSILDEKFVRKEALRFYRQFLTELRFDCMASGGTLMSHKMTMQSFRKGWVEFATDIQIEIQTLNTILE